MLAAELQLTQVPDSVTVTAAEWHLLSAHRRRLVASNSALQTCRAPVARAAPGEPRASRWRCDLCGHASFDLISTHDRGKRPLPTAICQSCGLVGHVNVPSDLQLADFYSTHYRLQYNGEAVPSPRRIMRAWKHGQIICRRLAPLLRPEDRVFEVGAGTGCTVKQFELAGFEASGIEPGQGFEAFAREKLRANVACRDLSDLPAVAQYNLVLLVHVIEHFNSPTRALSHIHSLIKPGGRLYVECPNLAAPFTVRWRLFHIAHIHNFTHSSLIMLAEKCGFRVETQYSDEQDPNLKVLFRRAETGRLSVDPQNYLQTLHDLNRNNARNYYLRWRYLWPRLQKTASYLGEFLLARLMQKKILKRAASGWLAQPQACGRRR